MTGNAHQRLAGIEAPAADKPENHKGTQGGGRGHHQHNDQLVADGLHRRHAGQNLARHHAGQGYQPGALKIVPEGLSITLDPLQP